MNLGDIFLFSDQPTKGINDQRLSWKNIPTDSGVYRIFNIKTNKTYIGATSNLRLRISMHLSKLKRGVHNSLTLSKELENFGIDNIGYQILEITNNITEREIFWFEFYKDNSFNKRPDPSTNKGVILDREVVEKQALIVSKALRGKIPKNMNLAREKQRRSIIQYKNGIFDREYKSCKEAGEFLGVSYKRINRLIVNMYKGKTQTYLSEYPELSWDYKDKKPPRIIKR